MQGASEEEASVLTVAMGHSSWWWGHLRGTDRHGCIAHDMTCTKAGVCRSVGESSGLDWPDGGHTLSVYKFGAEGLSGVARMRGARASMGLDLLVICQLGVLV